jgi:hypothetical protein
LLAAEPFRLRFQILYGLWVGAVLPTEGEQFGFVHVANVVAEFFQGLLIHCHALNGGSSLMISIGLVVRARVEKVVPNLIAPRERFREVRKAA